MSDLISSPASKKTVKEVNKSFTRQYWESCKNGEILQLKHYEIKHSIGKGTFGTVKLGVHIPTWEKVAIKILEKEKIEDEGDREWIQREI